MMPINSLRPRVGADWIAHQMFEDLILKIICFFFFPFSFSMTLFLFGFFFPCSFLPWNMNDVWLHLTALFDYVLSCVDCLGRQKNFNEHGYSTKELSFSIGRFKQGIQIGKFPPTHPFYLFILRTFKIIVSTKVFGLIGKICWKWDIFRRPLNGVAYNIKKKNHWS